MASTSVSNPSCIIEVEEYPYPSHNFAISIVTVKLSGKDVYNVWEEQMLCLLKSHDMLGFINGKFPSPFDGKGKSKVWDMEAWTRSDSLVKGWILGSLSEKVAISVVHLLTSKHKHKHAYFSAKDAWDELKLIYGPSVLQQTKEAKSTPIDLSLAHKNLYRLILQGITEKIDFRELELTPWDRITINGDTSLHAAVFTKNQEFLKYMLEMTPDEKNLLNVRNSDESTLLHVAAIVGNTEAVDVLVRRNPKLLYAKDKMGHTPLYISISNMHNKFVLRLMERIENNEPGASRTMFSGRSGDELLVLALSSKNFWLSLKLVRQYETIVSEAVLMAIAQNFPCELSFWERRDLGLLIFIKYLSLPLQLSIKTLYNNFCICVIDIDYHAWGKKHHGRIWKFLIFGISMIHMVSVAIIKKIVSPFHKERLQTHRDAIDLLRTVFDNTQKNIHSNPLSLSLTQYYTNPIFEATRLNKVVVVTQIVYWIPDAIWSINEDGLNFIQYAVINRSEKIYNLLYKMSEHKNIYRTIKDPYGNNLLHLAGRLAPTTKLNLISGAALQIQHELKWFKEVQKFVGPITRIQRNYAAETPEMVFNREHMGLVSEGEKWMKATAKSYTITAALIITIVFAAAITVPGGNDQISGIPIHNNNIAFKLFAVSDAISLFTAVTSLLMFLSILTTRFSAEDFLVKLPRRLIIGLLALFISTSAMIIAFGASLFLVFGHDNSWILIPIGVLTCLPITSFVTLQFPLIADLMGATYGRSIFDKKKPDVYFY